MIRYVKIVGLAALLAVSSIAIARAQDKPAAPVRAFVPLKVQLVIARYQGEKRLSSVPYTLSVTASEGRSELARLRIGTQVPIPAPTPAAPADGKPAPPSAAFNTGTSARTSTARARLSGTASFSCRLPLSKRRCSKRTSPLRGRQYSSNPLAQVDQQRGVEGRADDAVRDRDGYGQRRSGAGGCNGERGEVTNDEDTISAAVSLRRGCEAGERGGGRSG